MRKFVKGGVLFTTFVKDGERYLCTGEVTGELKFSWAGEVADYYDVIGATSVVSGDISSSVDELYAKWLNTTELYRSIGVTF